MINKLLGTLALTLMLASQANATSLSIVGPGDVLAGDSFSLQIFGNFADVGFSAGGLTFNWDPTQVQLDLITLNMDLGPVGPDPSFSCPGSPGCPANTGSSAAVVVGSFNTMVGADVTEDVLLATLGFTSSASAAEAIALFTMVDFGDFTGGWYGINLVPMLPADVPQFPVEYSLNINPVPLPAAVWFMVGGLGTLLGFRRK